MYTYIYLFWLGYHHVRFEEGTFDFAAKTLDDRMTERKIRDEVAVHHVQVQIIRAIVQQLLRFVVELRQVGAQNRRADFRA